MGRNSAPFYLRRTKEALVSFPDPETGVVKKLFTKRSVQTVEFKIDADEWDFYDALTRYVEQQSIKASRANETTGRAVGFTMAPGHPLFETVRAAAEEAVRPDLECGAVFYDLHTAAPYHLDVFSAAIRDGRGKELHRRLFIVQTAADGTLGVRQPTIFLDLATAPEATPVPAAALPERAVREQKLVEEALTPFLAEVSGQAARQTKTIREHLQISLDELIHRQQMTFAKLHEDLSQFSEPPSWLLGSIKQAEDRIDELNGRLERRLAELDQEEQCSIGSVQYVGSARVLPHPDRTAPGIAPMVRDEEIERIAVETVIQHEEARGWVVESVEKDNRGFDLISRRPHPEDPETAVEVRFIEVKGRAGVGEVALTGNEFKTAERLRDDFWLYVVFDCTAQAKLHVVRNPATLGWEPVVRVEHYQVNVQQILNAKREQAG